MIVINKKQDDAENSLFYSFKRVDHTHERQDKRYCFRQQQQSHSVRQSGCLLPAGLGNDQRNHDR